MSVANKLLGNSLIRPEILHTNLFNKKFRSCVSRNPIHLKIVVPYIGKFPPWQSILHFSDHLISRDCELLLITRPPAESDQAILSKADAQHLANKGVNLIIQASKLHSKIYQFVFGEGDRAAFVGSANLTKGGFSDNEETVGFFREKEDNNAVEREINRLASYGTLYQHWKVNPK